MLSVNLCFFQFRFVIDCNELRLSVTTTTLTVFSDETSYSAWTMHKSSEVMVAVNLFIVIKYRRSVVLNRGYTYPLGVPNTGTGGTKHQHF